MRKTNDWFHLCKYIRENVPSVIHLAALRLLRLYNDLLPHTNSSAVAITMFWAKLAVAELQPILNCWVFCPSWIILLKENKMYKHFKIWKMLDNQYSKHNKQLYISYQHFNNIKKNQKASPTKGVRSFYWFISNRTTGNLISSLPYLYLLKFLW